MVNADDDHDGDIEDSDDSYADNGVDDAVDGNGENQPLVSCFSRTMAGRLTLRKISPVWLALSHGNDGCDGQDG